MFKVGDHVEYRPINRATGKEDTGHIHFGKEATIIATDIPGCVWISIDDFPACNWREFHNRFYAQLDELQLRCTLPSFEVIDAIEGGDGV